MVRIYADSTNDLGPELIARIGVQIIPLYVTIGDTTGRDGVEITPDGIYEWANKTKQTPKTAAFPPKDVEPFIKDAKAVGDERVPSCSAAAGVRGSHVRGRFPQPFDWYRPDHS